MNICGRGVVRERRDLSVIGGGVKGKQTLGWCPTHSRHHTMRTSMAPRLTMVAVVVSVVPRPQSLGLFLFCCRFRFRFSQRLSTHPHRSRMEPTKTRKSGVLLKGALIASNKPGFWFVLTKLKGVKTNEAEELRNSPFNAVHEPSPGPSPGPGPRNSPSNAASSYATWRRPTRRT